MKRGILALGIVALLFVVCPLEQRGEDVPSVQSIAVCNRPCVLVIDAGHGGEDGGALSLHRAAESGINLKIALRLEDMLAFCGTPTDLLRREDISLHSPDASTLREKKSSDLHNRVAAVEARSDAILISIHQNSYPQSRYHGAQVFYAPTVGSKELAEHTQAVLRQTLDPGNRRQAKQIPDTIYLMNHITCPAILVECGFLSNAGEEALLRDPVYQGKVAAALASAYLSFCKIQT